MFVLQTLLLKRISGYNFNALEKQLGVSKIERVPLERINTDAVMKPLQRHVTNLADVVGHGYEKRVALPGIEIDIATNLKKNDRYTMPTIHYYFFRHFIKKKYSKISRGLEKLRPFWLHSYSSVITRSPSCPFVPCMFALSSPRH